MNIDQGRLSYATGIDNSQLRTDAQESRNILHSIGQTAQDESNRMDASFGKIAKAAGSFFAIGQITEFAKQIIAVRGEIESLQISFETLAGKTKGDALFGEIRQFAVSTPMMMKDLASGAQTMLAFNIEVEKVMPMLRAIGDISMGDAQKFNSLTLAFSQMSATGKLMGQDLLQMINAGFNPLSVISEKTGKSIGDLKDEMEKGKITTDMVTEAFLSATAAGGKFHGMLEKQSHGIEGAVSNMKGAIDDLYNNIGETSQGIITEAINGATYLVKNYEAIAEILAVIVGTYGVYKAAVITNEALIQAALTAKDTAVKEAFESEMAALTMLIPEKEAEAQTSLQQAVAAGHITQEKAAEIAMLRAEAQAQLEALAVTESAAKARLMASQSDIAAAIKWEDEIKDKIDALEEEADALFENGDSIAFNAKQEEIAALKAELLEIQKERETAVEAANTAATEMNTASLQQNAIATTQDSAATAVNTAQTTTNTGVTSALAIAKTKLIGVVRTLYATISAHPFALAAAAVAALAYGIYKLVTYETEAEKAQRRLSEAVSECEGSVAAERIQIDVMFDRLRKAKEGTDDYKDAKQAILDQYGNYLDGLSAEISSLKDVEGAYKAVTQAAIEAARARAMDAYVKKEGEEYAKQYTERFDKLYNIIKKKKGQAFADAHRQTINDVISGKSNWAQGFLSQFDEIRSVYMGQYAPAYTYTYNPLQAVTGQARQGEKDYAKLLQDARLRFGVANDKKPEAKADDKKQETHNKKYWEKQKSEAEAELAALTDIEAKGRKGQALRAKIAGYNKKLGYYSVSKKSGGRGNKTDVNQLNADMFANEAANRRKQEEEYAKQLADQVKDSEFEIRQARIEAMKDGIDKEMMQNELNYDRLIEQNRRRERDLLDSLADEQMRIMEDADPTLFKRKSKDGKWEEAPGKRDEMYREIRAKLTIKDLTDEQKKQLEEFGVLAARAFEQANKQSIDSMLQDVLTYEQQRIKITKEYARKREALYEKNEDGSIKTDADGNKVFRKGVTQGNLDEVNRRETEALKAVDEQFAQREEAYKVWCEKIATFSIDKLQQTLKTAEENLASLEGSDNPDSAALARARAEINKLRAQIAAAKARQPDPAKRTLKEWEDLHKVLSEVESKFEGIGDTFKGVVGDVISECGKLTTSTLSMINSIIQLQQWSVRSAELAAMGASKAVQTVEKASVILTIISAAMQIAMQIVNMFNTDNQRQEEIDALQSRIDQLQWELDNAEAIRIQQALASGSYIREVCNAVEDAHREILEAAAATDNWRLLFEALLAGSDSNTYLLTASAEKLAKAYANVAYSAGKALGNMRYDDAEEQLQNLAKQQILIQQQIDAEQAKKKTDSSAIEEWERKIAELGQQAVAIINDMVEEIIGDTSSGIAEQLADAFFNAFAAGEDAAKAWGDKVNDIVADVLKRMLVQKFLEQPLGEIFDKYKSKWFADGKFAGIDSIIDSMQGFANDLNSQFNAFKTAMDALPDDIKNYFTGDDQNREASKKGIATASQDSIDELNGRMTAIQSHTFSINETTRLLLSSTQAILHCVMNIESETSGFGARLARMEGDIKGMAASIDDIALKGIRLKK